MLPWRNKGDYITDFELESLRRHDGIQEKKCGNISSFGFTKKVFWKNKWDETTIKTRGLFVYKNRVVARGYDKFFNIYESTTTSSESLGNLSYPLRVYKKENGYLGLISYKWPSLFISSKTSLDGEHAHVFKSLYEKTISPNDNKFLCAFLESQEACLACEIIEPNFDPHIIEYRAPQIILLDVIHKNINFEKADFGLTKEIANIIGIKHKQLIATINNYDELKTFINTQTDVKHEGFVVEDGNNFMFKIKSDFYCFWKKMRSLIECLRNNKDEKQMKKFLEHPLSLIFYHWALEKNIANIEGNIIKIRKQFFAENSEIKNQYEHLC